MIDLTEEPLVKAADVQNKRSLSICNYKYKKLLANNVRHDSYFHTRELAKSDQKLIQGFLTPEMMMKKSIKTFGIQLPYPINYPKQFKGDPYKELLDEKRKYVKEFNHCVKLQKKKQLTKHRVEVKKQIPNFLMNLLDGSLKDPDPYLKTNHNFYYTGGILDKCYINDRLCLIHGVEKSNLGLMAVGSTDADLCTDLTDEIYNINLHQVGASLYTLVRHKHKLSLYETHLNSEIKISEVYKTNSAKVPYVDFKVNKYNESVLLELRANNKLSICNWENKKKVNVKLDADCFQFDYINENTVFLISPTESLIYDIRTCSNSAKVKHDKGIFECDYLSTFAIGSNRNYLYNLSTHNILKFDLRMLRVLHKSAHLLEQTPFVCKSLKFEDKQVLCATSSNFDDRILYVDDGICQRIPNVFETYRQMCLHHQPVFKAKLEDRLKLSTTGLCMIPNTKGFKIYTSNSIGEIFCNNVSNDQLESDASYSMLSNWIAKIPVVKEPLPITDIRPLVAVKGFLTKSVDEKRLERFTGENKNFDKFLELDVPDNNLNLKGIWEDDEESDDDVINTSDKVKSWLANNLP